MENLKIRMLVGILFMQLFCCLSIAHAFYAQSMDPEQAKREVSQERKNIEKRYLELQKKKEAEKKSLIARQEKIKAQLKFYNAQSGQFIETQKKAVVEAVKETEEKKNEDTAKNLCLIFLISSIAIIAIVVQLIYKFKKET